MIRAPALALAAQSLWTLACSTEKTFDTNVEIVRVRPIRRDLGDPSVVLTVDIEVSYAECPGEQRKMIRGDKAFAACVMKHKVGDKVPARLTWAMDDKGAYGNKIIKLAECERKLDPNDEASYEVVQDCEDLVVNGVVVGVHCDRKRTKELLEKCPWFRVR